MKSAQLLPSENLVFLLREIYDKYGYSRYKMNKFEEYDLYAKNKDFLISDGVITFTDTNGKLMALKPDVTLSIVKNTKDSGKNVQKLYYNENVYRVSKGTHSFKEITQVGLEAIGDIDRYTIFEVVSLAVKSLVCTGENCILEISHLGLLSDVINYVGVPKGEIRKVFHFIGEKNIHELIAFCDSLGLEKDKIDLLVDTAKIYGTADKILPWIRENLTGIADENNINIFETVIKALNSDENGGIIRIDFSAVDDIRYYNGFVFKGFCEGIPQSVLSGGQYDALMKNMKRQSGAIGFAVYLDSFENALSVSDYDVDVLLIYSDNSDISVIKKEADKIIADGKSVLLQREKSDGITYRTLLEEKDGEVICVENNA